MTVPELQKEAIKRNLNKSGKKQQLIARLSIWVRDEVAKADGISKECPPAGGGDDVDETNRGDADSTCSESTELSEELELFGEEFSDEDSDDSDQEEELLVGPEEEINDAMESDEEDITDESGTEGRMKSTLKKLFGVSVFVGRVSRAW